MCFRVEIENDKLEGNAHADLEFVFAHFCETKINFWPKIAELLSNRYQADNQKKSDGRNT